MRGAVLLLIACGSQDPKPVPAPAPAPVPAPAPAPDAGGISGMVDIAQLIPDARIDLRYATSRNLTHAPIYPPTARCLLDARVADRLVHAAAQLRAQHHRLLFWDCYRPFSTQELLWSRVHDPRYAAEPTRDARGRPVSGSVHSRGAAVDISLDGESMPTDHDDFTSAAHRTAASSNPSWRALDDAMTAAGFKGLATEWWHYDAPEGSSLPLRDDPLQ
jgi:D-alanyl-D-alanine dipeptidase